MERKEEKKKGNKESVPPEPWGAGTTISETIMGGPHV
jgi:hypothetical protein